MTPKKLYKSGSFSTSITWFFLFLKLSQVDLSDKIYASLLTAILIAPPIPCPTDKYHLSFLGSGFIPDELQSKTSFLCVPLSSPLDIKLILLLLIDFNALIIEWLPSLFLDQSLDRLKQNHYT